MPSLARSVPKPLKVPSLARSVHKPLKVTSLARSVLKPLKEPSLARSVPKPLSIFALHVLCPSHSQSSLSTSYPAGRRYRRYVGTTLQKLIFVNEVREYDSSKLIVGSEVRGTTPPSQLRVKKSE